MIGAITGDIVGSRFEFNNFRDKSFCLFTEQSTFTDDTVCTAATMEWLLTCKRNGKAEDYAPILQKWCKKYLEGRGYGGNFSRWIGNPVPYNSYGNGAGMRVSPVGLAFDNEADVLEYARLSAIVSHDHPEGIKGAQAIALSVFLAKQGKTKDEILARINKDFGYEFNFTCDEIRDTNGFDETCQVTVPQAITAFYESTSFEDAIRTAVSIGGDSDTIADMAGAIAEAFYGEVPYGLKSGAFALLPDDIKQTVEEFYATFAE